MIDTDAHVTIDAIDVAGVVNAMMRGDKYLVDASDPLIVWARATFGDAFLGRVFEVQS